MAEYTIPQDAIRAYETISAKAEKYRDLWAYYDGEQKIKYSTERLRKVFQDINARFSENWCAVVIDSALDRINLKSFDVAKNPRATEQLNELWQKYDLGLEAVEIHRAAQVCGEGYAIAWKDDEGETEAYCNDARQVHVFYDEDNPRKPSFAAKLWVDKDGFARLTLYYPDRLEYYISTKKAKELSKIEGDTTQSMAAKMFKPAQTPQAPNPFGKIPVFHFRLERRRIKSALTNVIEPQDAVNKLLSDMMVAAEYGAFKQRAVISQMEIKKGTLKNAPNEIWLLPAADGEGQDTSVHEFSPNELANYFNAIDKLVYAIGTISRTPKHYFMQQGGDPSGEALIAMEAPLNKKCQQYIDNFTPTWRSLAAFLLELEGVSGIEAKDIKPIFDKPETVQPRTQAEIHQLDANAGVPIVTQLRREGWSDKEIEDMQQDKENASGPPTSNPVGGGQSPPDALAQKRQQISELRLQARQQMAGAVTGNGNGGGQNGGIQNT